MTEPDVERWEDVPLALLLPDPRTAQDPVLDADRLAAVVRTGAHDPGRVQPLVADLLERAAEALDAPVGMVNVVLPGAQVVVGAHGLDGWLADAGATPVEWSLCATVVRSGRAYVVGDLEADPATADNPLCTHDGLRAYAGVPLSTPHGQVLGALCVLDVRPREFGAEQVRVLQQLAAEAAQRVCGPARHRREDRSGHGSSGVSVAR